MLMIMTTLSSSNLWSILYYGCIMNQFCCNDVHNINMVFMVISWNDSRGIWRILSRFSFVSISLTITFDNRLDFVQNIQVHVCRSTMSEINLKAWTSQLKYNKCITCVLRPSLAATTQCHESSLATHACKILELRQCSSFIYGLTP